jgi:4-hydroxybenzoate polyprenyltransferase
LRISHILRSVAALVRWREWYDSKLPLYLVAMVYVVLQMEHPGVMQAKQMAALLALFCCYAAFGHIVNDYADRDVDRKAGKKRLLASWSNCRKRGGAGRPKPSITANWQWR